MYKNGNNNNNEKHDKKKWVLFPKSKSQTPFILCFKNIERTKKYKSMMSEQKKRYAREKDRERKREERKKKKLTQKQLEEKQQEDKLYQQKR